jgi:GDP/UDP-N,N'-diacetylbacillosamine 2-epimerase (hydrolysing)
MVRSRKIKKKICVIASSRATYGYKKRILKLLKVSKKIDLSVVVTGMHPLKQYGYSKSQIIKDKIPITDQVDMLVSGDTPSTFVKSLGVELIGLAQSFQKIKPDLIIVTGDRGEMFAAAIAAAYMNIPVAHIQAGDVSGHIDGSARHAITKLSHIHLASCDDSAKRVINLGEEKWRVFNVGAPQLDFIKNRKKLSRNFLSRELKIDLKKKTLLCIHHPTLIDTDNAKKEIKILMQSILQSELQTIIIYPNIDSGNEKIIDEILKIQNDKIFIFKNLYRDIFIGLLDNITAMIGNSSSGILEAPSFKLPVVNIGDRQRGRMQAINVINSDFKVENILKSIKKATSHSFIKKIKLCKNPYGDGKSSKRIVKLLENLKIDKKLIDKRITY